MWKLLRILVIPIALLQGCENPSEVTVSSPTTTTQKIIWVLHPPPTPEMKVPTTTITTLTVSTSLVAYQNLSEPIDVWDIIAECESHGNWGARGVYEGGLQFHPDTWTAYVAAGKSYGLQSFPLRAYEATREQQIVVAIRVRDGIEDSSDPYLNAQGWNAWPKCRHAAGV